MASCVPSSTNTSYTSTNIQIVIALATYKIKPIKHILAKSATLYALDKIDKPNLSAKPVQNASKTPITIETKIRSNKIKN